MTLDIGSAKSNFQDWCTIYILISSLTSTIIVALFKDIEKDVSDVSFFGVIDVL